MERAWGYSNGSDRAIRTEMVHARKSLTGHIFGQITAGEMEEQRLASRELAT